MEISGWTLGICFMGLVFVTKQSPIDAHLQGSNNISKGCENVTLGISLERDGNKFSLSGANSLLQSHDLKSTIRDYKERVVNDAIILSMKNEPFELLVFEKGGGRALTLDKPGTYENIFLDKEEKVACGAPVSLKLLVADGLESNYKDADNLTALHWAALVGDVGVGEDLIRKGADVNASHTGGTPLHVAVYSYDFAKMLLDHGADVNSTAGGITPVAIAAREGRADVLRLLASRGADVSKSYVKGHMLIMMATVAKSLETVKALIELGADVNGRDPSGESALMLASFKGEYGIVKLLLEKGADVNHNSMFGETPISFATHGGHIEIVKELIAHGAQLNKPLSPLFAAISTKNLDIVRLLADKGADVNARNFEGNTPLMEAAKRGELAIAKELVARGADVNATNKNGKNALYFATHSRNADLTAFLQSSGSSPQA